MAERDLQVQRPMRPPVCSAALPLLLLLLATPVPAQETFEEATDVLVVEIPVQVTRDGAPVRGLTAEDFEVKDGRKRRPIIGFDVIDVSAESGDATRLADIPVSGRRHFLLLFDIALSRPYSIVRARQAATELVETSLHPSDRVAVGLYSGGDARLVLGFTSDREQIRLAIQTLGLPQLVDRAPDPLGIVLAQAPLPLGETGASVGGEGVRLGRDVEPGTEIQTILESVANEVYTARASATVQYLARAMSELAALIGAIQGNKHVVFLSEGFDSRIAFGAGAGSSSGRQVQQQAAESAMAGRYWEVDSNARFGSTHSLNSLELMAEQFVRAGATIQAVDIAGIVSPNDLVVRRPADDGLFMMADRTGGEHYRNFNDLGDAMGRMLAQTSVTYLLAIQPEALELDGRYRRLKVNLKRKLKGARLKHRPGYFAPRPYSQQSATERRLRAADLVLGKREGGSIRAAVETEVTQVAGNRRPVAVTVRIEPASVAPLARSGKLPLEVYAYALDSKEVVHDFFTAMLRLDLSGEGAADDDLRVWGQLVLPPGEYSLRTLIRNADTGDTGMRTTPLSVPAD